MAPWICTLLQPLTNHQMGVADARRQFFTWLRSLYAAAERDLDAPQRGPQSVDPPGQEFPSAVLNAMHDSKEVADPEAQEAKSSRPGSGIHEQEELPNADAMNALYGIGAQLVMRQGWQMHERLGRAHYATNDDEKDTRLVAPLTNDREFGHREGVGWKPPPPPARSRSPSRLRSEASSSSHGPASSPSQAGPLAASPSQAGTLAASPSQAGTLAAAGLQRRADDACIVCLEPIRGNALEYACNHCAHFHCTDEDTFHMRCPRCRMSGEYHSQVLVSLVSESQASVFQVSAVPASALPIAPDFEPGLATRDRFQFLQQRGNVA